MAQNASNDINYFLLLKESQKEYLGGIRQWSNLKVAFEGDMIWVKDFNYTQVSSLEVKSIPYKTVFYSANNKLHFLNSLLPERNIPSLLWTNIERAIPVKLPAFNHNYFGIQEKIDIVLTPCDKEQESDAMITDIATLKTYIESAPSIRLKNLQWSILNNDKALILGKPSLPIIGDMYWRKGNMIFPAGYDLELPLINEFINEKLNPDNNDFIIWNSDNTYALINKSNTRPLSLSSFRLSYIKHSLF